MEQPAAFLSDPTFYFALLTARVFLVVRGLDNIHQSAFKEPKDPVALWVMDALRQKVLE